jgi:hypothetical protein
VHGVVQANLFVVVGKLDTHSASSLGWHGNLVLVSLYEVIAGPWDDVHSLKEEGVRA